jgi:T5SS/PEP-CTERM-associated repeat protein/autotransporter-associated beta strand protein
VNIRTASPRRAPRALPRALPLCAAVTAALLAGTAPKASAATRTWVGGAPLANWLTTPMTNWSGGSPVVGDKLVFAGTQSLLNSNNIAGLSLAGISFAADAGAFVLSGNSLTSTGDIGNLSSQVQTLNMGITLAKTQFWTGGDAGMVFTGPIALGAYGLHLTQHVTIDRSGGDSPMVGSAGSNFSSLLDLAGGSRLLDQSGRVASVAGTSGWVTVRDAGSEWINSQLLQVGTAGAGRMDISGGGVVASRDSFVGGQGNGGRGTVSVSGVGSAFKADNLYFSDGTLTLNAGGQFVTGTNNQSLSALTALGGWDAAVTATVTGAGSAWVEAHVAVVHSAAVLNLKDSGLLSARMLVINGGTVNLDGGRLMLDADGAKQSGGVFNWLGGRYDVTGADGVTLGVNSLLDATTTLTAGKTLAVARTLTVGSGAALRLAGGRVEAGQLALNGSGYAAFMSTAPMRLATDIVGSGTFYVGAFPFVSGIADVVAPGLLTYTGSKASQGTVLIGAFATLSVGDGGTSGSLGGAVENRGALVFNRANSSSFDGVLKGAGTLTVQGGGTLVMTAINPYTGATRVNSGGIRMDGSATASAFTVAAGAQVGGTGSLGSLTLAGTLTPGDGPGSAPAQLTAGATTFAAGGNYKWEMADATGLAGAGYDTLRVNGRLALSATAAQPFTIHLVTLQADFNAGAASHFDPLQNYQFTLASASGAITGFSSDEFSIDSSGFANAFYGGQWAVSVSASGRSLMLDYTAAAVPEPQSLALLLAGLLAVGVKVRRQRAAVPVHKLP